MAVDAIAIGEYDITASEVAQTLEEQADLSNVKGLFLRTLNGSVYTPARELIRNLDDIPFASQFIKENLNEKDYFFAAATYPSIQIFTGRGCPFRCNFCVYPQTMHGHTFRVRSSKNIVDEFQYIADNFPDVREVVIEDDTFTANKKRVTEICHMLVER